MVKVYKTKTGFDLSKFTVVGSPTITDDGIASGFSMNTFVVFPFEHTSDNFSFEGVFNTAGDTTSNNKTVFCWCNTYSQLPSYYLLLAIQWSSGGLILGSYTNNVNYNIKYDARINYNDGKEHKYKVYYDGTNIKVDIDGDNRINEVYDLSAILEQVHYVTIGATKNQYYFRNGSIDLKQFSIIVDGVEVFNGQRDIYSVVHEYGGYDSSKFTIVGSPTITDDGVASGFSTSNYITTADKSILYGEKEIVHCFKNILLNSAENRHILFTIYGTSSAGYISTTFYNLSNTNKFEGVYRGTNISGDNYILNQTISSIDYTQPIDVELKIQGVNISVKIYQNNTMAGVEKTATLPFEYIDGYVVFGTQKYSPSINYNQLNGQIDLSKFSITTDGITVFDGRKDIYKGFNV